MNNFLVTVALFTVAHAAPQFSSFSPFATPTVLPDGHLADTPEVAAAKAAHFAEHAKALGTPFGGVAPASHFDYNRFNNPFSKSLFNGPFAAPTILPSGYLADTPEVSAARSAHFSEHAKALVGGPTSAAFAAPVVSHFDFNPYYQSSYRGPLAFPTVLPNGYLADTPEVAAAKAAHFAEHAKALSGFRF